MSRTYAGLTEVEILDYNYAQHKVVNKRDGSKEVLVQYEGRG